ncbi:putative transaminase [Lupinus albus]|uniref:Branched-chain-amino-acid aminotransferase n=1 Tax=Lupinus albus TaxID=3870 RepID=A0A6A4Q014_LUPAL|nr:putative transaminase [Lupinus albus]
MASPSFQATSELAVNSVGCERYEDIKWDEIGFGIVATDFMYVMKCSKGEKFSEGNLIPYGNIELTPSAGILNYGQGVLEGLKAYRTEDMRILLFRPQQNALRIKIGAERMCMPSPSIHQFLNAINQTVLANIRWVPPVGQGSLYIRPLLMGTGSVLGLAPAHEYTLLIYATPVKSYHKGPLKLVVKDELHRAISGNGGTGGIKSVTNYSPTYKAGISARAEGFSDVLYLDAATGKFIEEVSSCNIFVVKGNTISTPKAEGSILPGITRKSIIDIAIDLDYKVEERGVEVEELLMADEVFCTGTAVVVIPVLSVTYNKTNAIYKTGSGTVSQKLYETLVAIQTGHIEDTKGWTVQVN